MKTASKRRPPRPIGNAEMEDPDAARGNYAPADAIRISAHIVRQTTMMWRGKLVATPVNLYDVLRALISKRVPFVLTGAYAIGSWTGRPRATHDVDILARPGRNHTRAVNAIKVRFPELEVRAIRNVTAFFVPGEKESVIDVALPHRNDNEEALVDTVWVDDKVNGVRYRIPSRECAMANKYGAMLVPTRPMGKRQMDVVDFSWMVLHSSDQGQNPLNLIRVETLGEMVWPGGGGKELLKLIEKVKAGKEITLAALAGQS